MQDVEAVCDVALLTDLKTSGQLHDIYCIIDCKSTAWNLLSKASGESVHVAASSRLNLTPY